MYTFVEEGEGSRVCLCLRVCLGRFPGDEARRRTRKKENEENR